jgi:hypothetical protein
MGTIVGHYDMMMAMGCRCGNETTKNKQQLRDIVVKYLQENPAQRSDAAASLSFVAPSSLLVVPSQILLRPRRSEHTPGIWQ